MGEIIKVRGGPFLLRRRRGFPGFLKIVTKGKRARKGVQKEYGPVLQGGKNPERSPEKKE